MAHMYKDLEPEQQLGQLFTDRMYLLEEKNADAILAPGRLKERPTEEEISELRRINDELEQQGDKQVPSSSDESTSSSSSGSGNDQDKSEAGEISDSATSVSQPANLDGCP